MNRRGLVETGAFDPALDGATVNASGDLGAALRQVDQLIRVSPRGELLETVDVPVRVPSCPAFGGAELATLFVTSISDAGDPFISDHPDAGRKLAITRLDTPGMAEARCTVLNMIPDGKPVMPQSDELNRAS